MFEKGSSILTSTSRVFGPIAIFKHSNRVSTEKKNEMNISFTVHFDFGLLVFFLFLVLCSLGSLPLCSLFAFSLLTYSSYNALTIICWPCARSTLTIRALLLCQRNSVPPHIKTGYTYLRLLYLPKIGWFDYLPVCFLRDVLQILFILFLLCFVCFMVTFVMCERVPSINGFFLLF